MNSKTPFHEGELSVQKKLGVTDTARMNGSVITNRIPGGAINFIAQQAMVVLGNIDASDRIWASIVFGTPGFTRALNDNTIEINLSDSSITANDPIWKNIQSSLNIGMIIIELGSRRRLRVNGQLKKITSERYHIIVDQAYPNCPQYIQRRHITKAKTMNLCHQSTMTKGYALNSYQQSLITTADTFFVASAHPEQGVDVSHRGGNPGFIKIINDKILRIPDYQGNSMFNTLGNFEINPHAGLVFIDFAQKKLVQITGQAKVLWHISDSESETGGTLRFWDMTVDSWRESHIPFDIDWEYLDASPFNPQPSAQQENHSSSEKGLQLRVEKITQITPRIKSFILKSKDKKALLPEFSPGAHLQITINSDSSNQLIRHYSILSHPDDRSHYEIAVLEEPNSRGGSSYMHNKVHVDDLIHCSFPINDFPMSERSQHSILIAGGIGITPILSMVQKLTAQQESFELHYAVKERSEQAFIDRIKKIAADKSNLYISSEKNSRLDINQLLANQNEETHIYVCGPVRLIKSVQEQAHENNWPDNQIHFESFGSQSTKHNSEISVHLARSNLILKVPPEQSILDHLLEQHIEIPHQCKRGECGMCVTTILDGVPEHHDVCLTENERKKLMCLCVSRANSKSLILDL